MPLSLFGRNALACGFLAVAAPALVQGQINYVPNGVEYAIAGSLDKPQVAAVPATPAQAQLR